MPVEETIRQNVKIEAFRRRRARRSMAWIALWSMMFTEWLLFFYVDVKRLPLLDNFITMYLMCMASIVLGYLGVATWDDLNNLKHGKLPQKLEEQEEGDIAKK